MNSELEFLYNMVEKLRGRIAELEYHDDEHTPEQLMVIRAEMQQASAKRRDENAKREALHAQRVECLLSSARDSKKKTIPNADQAATYMRISMGVPYDPATGKETIRRMGEDGLILRNYNVTPAGWRWLENWEAGLV